MLIRVKREEAAWFIRVLRPNAFIVVAAVHSHIKQPRWCEHGINGLQHGGQFVLGKVEQAIQGVDRIKGASGEVEVTEVHHPGRETLLSA